MCLCPLLKPSTAQTAESTSVCGIKPNLLPTSSLLFFLNYNLFGMNATVWADLPVDALLMHCAPQPISLEPLNSSYGLGIVTGSLGWI